MTSILIPSEKSLASASNRKILCCHTNVTSRIQIIRIADSPNLDFERVVFPGQRLMFEAEPEANVEIRHSEAYRLIVPCQRLRVTEISADA